MARESLYDQALRSAVARVISPFRVAPSEI
jgi:hypothetical protein